MAEPRTAFELLLDMDRRCRSLAAGLPLQEAHQQDWIGIGFRMGEQRFVALLAKLPKFSTSPLCRYAGRETLGGWRRQPAWPAAADHGLVRVLRS